MIGIRRMTDKAQTLVEFLLARIAEDERAWTPALMPVTGVGLSGLCKRLQAECEAKRRIVGIAQAALDEDTYTPDIHEILATLAPPYAEHSDYQERWRDLRD